MKIDQAHKFIQFPYKNMNARQRENYNYQKVAGVLADYGFITHRLSADWNGADFIAQHISSESDGESVILHVQLKSRFTLAKKYERSKKLYICFPDSEDWYIYLHDDALSWARENTSFCESASWKNEGLYSLAKLGSKGSKVREFLRPYKINRAENSGLIADLDTNE